MTNTKHSRHFTRRCRRIGESIICLPVVLTDLIAEYEADWWVGRLITKLNGTHVYTRQTWRVSMDLVGNRGAQLVRLELIDWLTHKMVANETMSVTRVARAFEGGQDAVGQLLYGMIPGYSTARIVHGSRWMLDECGRLAGDLIKWLGN